MKNLIDRAGNKHRRATLAVLLFAAFMIPAKRISPANEGSPEVYFRAQLSGFLQSGVRVDDILPSHPLYTLRRIPIVATTTYLVMEHDESLLHRFYPILTEHVINIFREEKTIGGGLIFETANSGGPGEVYLSPAVNALANLELHSLFLIAQRLGKHEDAIELLSWSRRFSEMITRTFYDPARGCFFPINKEGAFLVDYSPEQLLPLLLDTGLSDKSKNRIVKRFIYKRGILLGTRGEESYGDRAWDDPLFRTAVIDLLSNSPHLGDERLDALAGGTGIGIPSISETPSKKYWMEFWNGKPSSKKELLPPLTAISSLTSLTHILEAKSLLKTDELKQLKEDIDTLGLKLEGGETGLDSHVETISMINRLLARMSKISSTLDSDLNIWKVFDDFKWKELSPRTKKLIKQASSVSLDELMTAKSILSGHFMNSAGIIAKVRLPERPVPIGQKVSVEASIKSTRDSIEISRVYLQIGENRWKITGKGEKVMLAPGIPPFTYKTILPLPPSTEPGIATLPLFFDFLHGGRRIEIHGIESISLAKSYDVSLTFPEGRRLGIEPLPVRIILKYQPGHDTQGLVEGSLLKDLHCSPELPARFLVKKGADITTLPLEITSKDKIPPGVYPFYLSVLFNGKAIASFEENLVCPMRWFHLGPMTDSHWILGNASHYQDDLFKTHRTSGGEQLNWQEVPPGAIGGGGAVLPERLYGNVSERCLLLYTVVDAPVRMKALWKLETRNSTSLWINSELVLSAAGSAGENSSGQIALRKGLNSFLIASCWGKAPDRVLFAISDETGLPVSGMSNEIDRIVDGFEKLTVSGEEQITEASTHDHFREVTFDLEYPEASDVCVIGSFNSWKPGATPMEKDKYGNWTVKTQLPAGKYPYKFLIDHKKKITDPGSNLLEADGFGGLNSILVVD